MFSTHNLNPIQKRFWKGEDRSTETKETNGESNQSYIFETTQKSIPQTPKLIKRNSEEPVISRPAPAHPVL